MHFRFLLALLLMAASQNACQESNSSPQTSSSLEVPIAQATYSLDELIQVFETNNEVQAEYHKIHWVDTIAPSIREVFWNDWVQILSENHFADLSPSEQINKDLLTLIFRDQLSRVRYGAELMPLNSEGGFLTEIYYAVSATKINSETDANQYLQKIEALPAYLKLQQKRMQRGLKENKTVPALIVKRCLSLLDEHLAAEGYFEMFLAPLSGNAWPEQHAKVKSYVNEAVRPAYQAFKAFLEEEYLPQTRQSIGISKIEMGDLYYEDRVHYFTTLEISPDSVFAIGEMEVKRIRAEMDSIVSSLAWEGDFASFLQFLRTDPQFYPQSPEALLARAAWLSKKAEGFLPDYFGHLPRMPFTVEPVPAAIAPNYTGGRYSEGSYENHKAGAYWVNTFRLKTRPLYVLPALTLHEAVPGHHTQIMLAQELADVPKFRQEQYLSAFGEGWALYAEYLGKEAGMYETPYEHFGALTYEMWRACRLVVDVGMHYKDWTREEAVKFMSENTALSLHEVNTEIDRYIGWPGQALSYKMGELTIRALRKEAEQRLGEKFDIRDFHDLVLAEGSIPMQSLKRRVREWIERSAKQ
ncbi:MAG: DUF885 domain-containing protein [Bacteroidota bacterium]